jgi:hypothetical protein
VPHVKGFRTSRIGFNLSGSNVEVKSGVLTGVSALLSSSSSSSSSAGGLLLNPIVAKLEIRIINIARKKMKNVVMKLTETLWFVGFNSDCNKKKCELFSNELK